MHNPQELIQYLLPEPDPKAPEFIVYSPDPTARLNYVCRFIFTHVLKCRYVLTQDAGQFETAKGFPVNYSGENLGDYFTIRPHGLLSENKVPEARPEPFYWKEGIYFFETEKGQMDIFAAVFYFISRCEEWQAFEPDRHGRFETKASLLHKHNSHLKPVVDIWINELRQALENFYSGLEFPPKDFRLFSTIDIDNLYAYRHKGLVRTAGAIAKDLLKFDFANLRQRLSVLIGGKKDPFDIYEEVSGFCQELGIPLCYFFLFRTGTEYDRTVDPRSPAFRKVFATIKKMGAFMGLHPSYQTVIEPQQFQKEMDELSSAGGEPVLLSRQHFLRFNIRTTPNMLLKAGIKADFSMGFASTPGFRAGTTYPFYYYDFNAEQESALLFVPFCVMDGVYTIYTLQNADKGMQEMMSLANEVEQHGGIFTSVFHERSFSDHLYSGFGTLYKNLYLRLKGQGGSKN